MESPRPGGGPEQHYYQYYVPKAQTRQTDIAYVFSAATKSNLRTEKHTKKCQQGNKTLTNVLTPNFDPKIGEQAEAFYRTLHRNFQPRTKSTYLESWKCKWSWSPLWWPCLEKQKVTPCYHDPTFFVTCCYYGVSPPGAGAPRGSRALGAEGSVERVVFLVGK